MNLSIELKAHIDEVLNDKALGQLYPILEVGQIAYKSFMKANKEFFKYSDILNNVPGNMLSYSISKQFKPEFLSSKFPFSVTFEQINENNGYTIPIIHKDDISISFIRSRCKGKLDTEDKRYLKERCKKNDILDDQMQMFDFLDHTSNKFHGTLVYGMETGYNKIAFADIVFFESKLRKPNHNIDLMKRLKIYENKLTTDEKKKNILTAENLLKDFKKENSGG